MNFTEIQFGGLYHYPQHDVVVNVYEDPKKDNYSKYVFTIQKGIPFVPLELIQVKKEKNFYRLKVLTSTGKIGWMVFTTDSPKHIQLVTA
jgi:hypothetical protein